MKTYSSYTVLLALLWLWQTPIHAQRFSAGVGTGLIFSQMDGDGFTGYDKAGKRIGLRGQAYISETVDFIIEMNWEEKGSKFESNEDPFGEKNRTVHLVYAEIPVLFRFFRKKRNNLFGELGASISYLVKNRFSVMGEGNLDRYEEISADFNRSEWNFVLGAGYQFDRHFGILFRTTIGLQHLYRDRTLLDEFRNRPAAGKDEEVPIAQLRNYLVSIGAYYII